jgi:hypothetical protein
MAGCGPTVTIKHEVEPILLTVNVNIRVEKELEEFFDFEKSRDEKAEAGKGEAKKSGTENVKAE